MYIGNAILLILNLPLVGLWARLVTVPHHYIVSLIVLFSFIGTYTVRNSLFDVGTCLGFGLLGYVMSIFSIPALPLVLGVILTPMLEDTLRQTYGMGGGSIAVLFQHPIALALIAGGLLVVLGSLYMRFRWSQKVSGYLSADEY